jgi:radical SAM superfamily enzyme YgiQ (UPF0313 family)
VELLDLSAVLVYPSTRDVAFSSLGFLKVRDMLSRRVGLTDISYLPGRPPGRVVSRKQGLLLGERTAREVRDFDIVAFSISYENDYTNVARLIDMAGLYPMAEERAKPLPLVLFGGFAMFMNPLPMAPFADAVVVGEAEPVIDAVLGTAAGAKQAGLPAGGAAGRQSRESLHRALGDIDGVFVPSVRQERVERAWTPAGDFAPEPPRDAESRDAHFKDMYLIEMGRGCGRNCLFCATGSLYKPVRMRDAGLILRTAEGAGKVGLVGPAVADHPQFLSILEDLVGRGIKIGVSSLRADRVSPGLAALLARGGMRTATIAPEAGSEGLRGRIGKHLSDEQIVRAVRSLSDAGIPTIKLYFMIGLPGETEGDVGAIVRLVTRLAGVRGKSRLTVSAAPFVPKPHTCFEREPFAGPDVLRRRAGILRRIRSVRGCALKVASIQNAWLEACLARADERVAPLILEAAREGRSLRTLLRRSSLVDPETRIPDGQPLPWDKFGEGH